MSERRLPPALEEAMGYYSRFGDYVLPVATVLDWLYGDDGEPDILRRIEDKAVSLRFATGSPGPRHWSGCYRDAIRQELGLEGV